MLMYYYIIRIKALINICVVKGEIFSWVCKNMYMGVWKYVCVCENVDHSISISIDFLLTMKLIIFIQIILITDSKNSFEK